MNVHSTTAIIQAIKSVEENIEECSDENMGPILHPTHQQNIDRYYWIGGGEMLVV